MIALLQPARKQEHDQLIRQRNEALAKLQQNAVVASATADPKTLVKYPKFHPFKTLIGTAAAGVVVAGAVRGGRVMGPAGRLVRKVIGVQIKSLILSQVRNAMAETDVPEDMEAGE